MLTQAHTLPADKLSHTSPYDREVLEIVTTAVCKYYDISFEQLMQPSKLGVKVIRRQILYYLLIAHFDMKQSQVAKVFSVSRSIVQYGHSEISDKKSIYKSISVALTGVTVLVNEAPKKYAWRIE